MTNTNTSIPWWARPMWTWQAERREHRGRLYAHRRPWRWVTCRAFHSLPHPLVENTPMRRPLTDRQRNVLRWIADFIDLNALPPTNREIGEGLGIRSPNGVRGHLLALEGKGHLQIVRGRSRGIRLLTPGQTPPPPVPILPMA